MTVDDRGGEIDKFAILAARLIAQLRKRAGLVNAVAFHADALGSLDQRAASERLFELVVFGEAAQHDVDRTLPVLDVVVCNVSEHASLGCFFDERWVGAAEQRYDRSDSTSES